MSPPPGHVLITGASRGLGEAFARALAEATHPVSLLARSTDLIETIARDIKANGGQAQPIACDVADASSVERAVQTSVSANGPIGILVNNAGVVEPVAAIADADPIAWARQIAVNLIGAFNVLHFAAPHLCHGAVVVNVSSGAANDPFLGRSAYCASKAGLNMLGRVFEMEEAKARGLRVYNLTPGPTDTSMHVKIREAPINRTSSYRPQELRPAEDAARFLVWLCSNAEMDLTGQFVNAGDPILRRRAGLE